MLLISDPIFGYYPEPVKSSSHNHTLFPWDQFQYYRPIHARAPLVVSYLQMFKLNFCMNFSHVCCMSLPSHPPITNPHILINIYVFRSFRVRFPGGARNYLFTTASRTALRPTQPPIQWPQGTFSLGVKRSGRGNDHSPPSSAEVRE